MANLFPQRYRDDDLKGKGEPAFSLDQSRREKQKAVPSHSGTVYYEMQPTATSSGGTISSTSGKHKEGHGTHVRQRSVSNGDQLQQGYADEVGAGSSGLQRSNTTGKSLTQSLKRRFGSLRRRKGPEEAGY